MQSGVQTLSSKDHRKLWITAWSSEWSLVLFLVLLHFQPNISIMWIWWKFFTCSILPKDNVWIFFLIYRSLCLSTLTFSPFILLLPLQYFFLHTLLLAIAQMSHMRPSAWKAIHVANSDSFLKSKHGLLLKSHTMQQIFSVLQHCFRHHFTMVPWNLVLTPDTELSHGIMLTCFFPQSFLINFMQLESKRDLSS